MWLTLLQCALYCSGLKLSRQHHLAMPVQPFKLQDLGLQSPRTSYLVVPSLRSCPTLCNPVDCSPPGSSVHGMLQAGILEWVAMPSSRGSSWPRDLFPASLMSPALAGRFFTTSATWEALLLGWIGETKWVIHKPSSIIFLPSVLMSLYYYLLVIFFFFSINPLLIKFSSH